MAGGTVKSLQKAIKLIDSLAENEEMGVTELSRKFDMSKSSVYNMLNTFAQNHWVEKNEVSGKYQLGLRLFELGNVVRDGLKLREIAAPFMKEVVNKVEETVHLTVMDEGMVVYIETLQPGNKFSIASLNERRVHMHCTGVGKAILAFQTDEKIDQIITEKGLPGFTPNTITEPEELKEHLAKIRERGFAVDDIEHEPGVRCVAAPIRNEKGKVFSSVSVTGPSPRFTFEKIDEYAAIVMEATRNISKNLGWNGEYHRKTG